MHVLRVCEVWSFYCEYKLIECNHKFISDLDDKDDEDDYNDSYIWNLQLL